jgi:hypothetical protein
MGAQVVTVNDVLDGHVAVDIQCLNRIYLNAYIPRLQTSAQVVAFLSGHLGYPFPSPALFNHLGRRFRRAVASYAEANDIPWVQLGKDDDKLAVMRAHLDRQATTDLRGGAGVPAGLGCHPGQDFHRHATVVVLQGRPPGDLLLLLPVGCRFRPRLRQGVCLLPLAGQGLAQRSRVGQTPGHQGRRRLHRTLQRVRRLPGSTSAAAHLRPARSGTIGVFIQRWLARLPLPLTDTDRDAGYWWETSMRQVELAAPSSLTRPGMPAASSRRGSWTTSTSAAPTTSRDHLRPPRPPRHHRHLPHRHRPPRQRWRAHQRVLPPLPHQAIPQRRPCHAHRDRLYHPPRPGLPRPAAHLDELQAKARAYNQRILQAERVGQGCALASPAFERIAHPTVDPAGRRTPQPCGSAILGSWP